MRTEAQQEEIDAVRQAVADEGLETYVMVGAERIVMGVVGTGVERVRHVEGMAGVEQLIRVSKPYKLASNEHHPDRSSVRVGDIEIGAGAPLAVIAGPCAVESRDQILATARWVRREGATLMRGGAFKPRSSPYAFQGLGIEGLKLLAEAREETGLPVVSEITDPADVEVFDRYVDMLQVGARNMANFVLLKAVGQSRKPVLLKRGLSATIEEWLMAAEYILSSGNPNVVLCERGIRTFETATRNTLDLSAVPVIQERTHLPVVIDPSHGTGHRTLVRPLAVAGAAVGADGIIIEVHPDPPTARSDSEQSLSFPEFGDLMDDLRRHEYLRHPTAPGAIAPSEPPAERKRLRARIEDVDARIAALLEERAELSVAVQQTRASDDHGHDVGRERELIERASRTEGGVLTAEEREMVFGAILRVSRSAQRRSAAAHAAASGGASADAALASSNGLNR
ncbi:MAG TPA: bifunctional 3-deoxy-7-phosphoheptulonate synthase/chorismate mutase [Candidatus Limnocylindrales bacterium]|nr:bifunctional 3-deoxy-7-phosphoheptulonate synthase/chorismate mutase [Candidatus Limnocylindrales bacterium]